jgi:hypothetical protein
MAKQKTHVVRIYNNSQQMIALQVRAPGGDFYKNEQQVRLSPGQDALLPKNFLLNEQIKNLVARGMLKVTYDSELLEDQEQILTS